MLSQIICLLSLPVEDGVLVSLRLTITSKQKEDRQRMLVQLRRTTQSKSLTYIHLYKVVCQQQRKAKGG
jgi:hypothetical protein